MTRQAPRPAGGTTRRAAALAALSVAVALEAPAFGQPGEADRAPVPLRLDEMDDAIVDLVKRAAALVDDDPTKPANWMQLGMIYQANLQYDLARRCYGRVLELRPNAPRAHYYLALCHNRLGETTAAIDAMERVTVHDPTYLPAWWRLGLWHLESGNLDEAERAARRVADEPAGGVVLARVFLQKGVRDEAVSLLERLVVAHPGDRHAHMLLGTAYRQLGRTEEAQRELNLGRGDPPERPDPWVEQVNRFFTGYAADRKRADALLEEGRLDEAIGILTALRAKRPNDVSAISHLAVAYRRTGEIDEAIALLREAIEIQPGYDLAHFHLAAAYRQKFGARPDADPQLLELAMAHADRVLELSPTFAEGHSIRADILVSLGRSEEAVASLLEAIRCDSGNPLWSLRCGALLLQMGEGEAAIPRLETAAKLDPSSLDALLALASAHLNLRQLEEARGVLQAAARLAPEHAGIQQALQQIDQALQERAGQPPAERDEEEG